MIIGTVILFIFYLALKSKFYEKIIYSLIAGGALGNYYDRLVFKAVPDFIDLHFYNFHWFTFNFADIFITIGIILLLTQNIFIKDA
jgi:signal peptidase II